MKRAWLLRLLFLSGSGGSRQALLNDGERKLKKKKKKNVLDILECVCQVTRLEAPELEEDRKFEGGGEIEWAYTYLGRGEKSKEGKCLEGWGFA